MKKIISMAMAIMLVAGVVVFGANGDGKRATNNIQGKGYGFVDLNKDGINDRFVDANGDGIDDNWKDENKDGINDNRLRDGNGYGKKNQYNIQTNKQTQNYGMGNKSVNCGNGKGRNK